MKLFKITLISCLLAFFTTQRGMSQIASTEKNVFALNNLRFMNTPEFGILSHINAENYTYNSEKSWVKNNELFYPIDTDLVTPLTLEDAIDLEIQLAMKSGINGFALLYIISNNKKMLENYDQIISTYVKVIDEKGYDFKLMIAVKVEFGTNIHEGIFECGTHLAKIYDQSKDFKHWYRLNGKKALLYYRTKGLTSHEQLRKWVKMDDSEFDMTPYFDRISEITSYLGDDIASIYNVFWPTRRKEIETALERFETVYFEKSHILKQQKIDQLASILKSKNRPFIQTIVHSGISSYYGVNGDKVKRPLRYVTSNSLDINDCYKEYDDLNLSKGMREGFSSAIRNDASLVILDSWNIFVEHSHFRPSFNNGWGLSVLLNQHIDEFKQKKPEESIVMTYLPKQINEKDYLEYKRRNKYSYPASDFEKENIEFITYLDTPAEFYFRDEFIKLIPEGKQVTLLPWKGGSTSAYLKRDGKKIMEINSHKKVCSVKNRNNPVKVYLSDKDQVLYDEMIEVLAHKEVDFFKHRFILTPNTYKKWIDIEKEKMSYYVSILNENEKEMSSAFSKKEKYDKGYRVKVKGLLSPFDYNIWEEIISEKMEYAKPIKDYDIHDFENSYNVLQAN